MPDRRDFCRALLLAGASAAPLTHFRAKAADAADPRRGPAASTAKPFGSGHFGEWVEDEFGLPAYRYTCNQIIDPAATTYVNVEWRSPTDHTHQMGNDRLVAAVSNYGYVQVRQDEGSPKFLNDYFPPRHLYGGGIGYLTDGNTSLCTYYSGRNTRFERVFGLGYFRKQVESGNCHVDQIIFVPFGDDPILISQVTITNRGHAADLRWVEYWGCQAWQFSFRSMMEAGANGRQAAALRRAFGERFSHRFEKLSDGRGLAESKAFLGRTPQEEKTWEMLREYLKKNPNALFGPSTEEAGGRAWMEDLNPPATFLAALDAPADGLATNAKNFFGSGDVEHPEALARPLDGDLGSTGPESALLVERRFRLARGEKRTLYFAYGYLPEGFKAQTLIEKYRGETTKQLAASCARWKEDSMVFRVQGEPWVEREVTWHHYYLRSNLTFDDYFGEHILSQGHVYQYIMGFQGAARDPLQHALPFVYSRPEIVRSVLRYTLQEVLADGAIPYGIVGHGMIMSAIFRPSDLQMWLLWLASEYVLATRDAAFLDEAVPAALEPGSSEKQTVRRLLARAFDYVQTKVGNAEHGLMRISNGDWNDNAVVGFVPPELHAEVHARGESVLNAAMATYALGHYARLLRWAGDGAAADRARASAEAQREAVRKQWMGRWFRRAWLTEKLGWVGEKELWLEPQPWAIIGGAATPEQTRELVRAIDELVRKPSPIGALLISRGLPQMQIPIGEATNAGVWPSINGTLIWALALADGAMAWDEWKKNCLARHAEAYPNVWFGIWSGPDTYNSTLSQYPGLTLMGGLEPDPNRPGQQRPAMATAWTDFPVMNMHPHAWPLYCVPKLLGVEFTEEGVELAPTLPVAEYEFSTRLLGLRRTPAHYEGWYEPIAPGTWKMRIRLPKEEAGRFKSLLVNGETQKAEPNPRGEFEFTGTSSPGKPLRWKLA